MNLPSVTCGVNSREGDAAIEDLEVRLVLQHQCADSARRDSLSKANDRIVIDDCALLDTSRQSRDAGCGSEELESQRLNVEEHLEGSPR
jgi:hypothetical protein